MEEYISRQTPYFGRPLMQSMLLSVSSWDSLHDRWVFTHLRLSAQLLPSVHHFIASWPTCTIFISKWTKQLLHHFIASGPTIGYFAIRLQCPSATAECVLVAWENCLLNPRSIAFHLQGPSAIAESVPLHWRTACSSLILHHFNASESTVGCIAIRLQGPSAIVESIPYSWRTACSIRSVRLNVNVQTKCTF
jgi:hypothetical protein